MLKKENGLTMKKKIALLGGSFDPLHIGHEKIVKALLENTEIFFDKVYLLPTPFPVHKKGHRLLPFSLRMYLAKLVFQEESRVEVKDIEYFLEAPTKTYATVRALKDAMPEAEFYFVVGEDEYVYLEQWYNLPSLAKLCSFIVVQREKSSATYVEDASEKKQMLSLEERKQIYLEKYQLNTYSLSLPHLPFSSRKLRPILSKLFSFDDLANEISLNTLEHLLTKEEKELLFSSLSPKILTYLLDTRAYALFEMLRQELSEESYQRYLDLDKLAYEQEGLTRTVHSQHVAFFAYAFSKNFLSMKEREELLYAAVLHDIAKKFDKEKSFLYEDEERLKKYPFPVWHGLVGANYLRKEKIYTNEKALQAIAMHTSLDKGATRFDCLLFLADKLEFSRFYPDLPLLRKTLLFSVEEASKLCLLQMQKVLEKRGEKLSEESLAALNEFSQKEKEENEMSVKKLTDRIFEILDNKRAEDVQVLEVTEKTSLADYFVIATGTSTTHVNALAEEVEYQLKEEEKRSPLAVEGLHNGHWILLDYGDVVVHIFHKEDREYYKLDKLWEKMPKTFEVA